MALWTALILVGGLVLQVFIPGFPKETLLLQAGISYSVIGGTIINWLGMVLAAQVGYEVVLHSIQVGGRFSKLLETYQDSDSLQYLQQRGNYGLFFIRLVPYAPNDVLSLLSGGLMLPRRGFILVSMITALPYAFVFAYLGDLGSSVLGRQTVWLINLTMMVVVTLGYGFYQFLIKPRRNTI